MEAELDNVRAALTWAMARSELAGEAADLIVGMSWFWRIHSHVLEARNWLDKGLMLAGLTTARRAALLYHVGHFAWMQDDFELASQREQESLALWQSLGAAGRRGAAYALSTLGMARYSASFHSDNDVMSAVEAFQSSLVLFREVGDSWGVAFAQGWIARCQVAQGLINKAIASVEENVADHERLGEVWGLGMAIGMLASLAMQSGDLTAARAHAERAQALRTRVGHRHSIAVGWELLGDIAEAENNPDEAAAAYREAIALLESLGNRPYADELRSKLAAIGERET